ncbi:MAG TPA: hypothetical protein VN867_15690 [Candidatus Binataceae bacterium]|nr:hypothetical protein [Candidatus Binataceae bacterium]
MNRAPKHRDKSFLRNVALVAAIMLVLGQTLAAAHFHRVSTGPEFSQSAVAGIADGGCAVCVAHFHSPAVFAVVPALNAPVTARDLAPRAIRSASLSARVVHRFGRAPPASI